MGEDQEAKIKELEQKLKIKELEQKLGDKPIEVNITDEDWTKNLVAFIIIVIVAIYVITILGEY